MEVRVLSTAFTLTKSLVVTSFSAKRTECRFDTSAGSSYFSRPFAELGERCVVKTYDEIISERTVCLRVATTGCWLPSGFDSRGFRHMAIPRSTIHASRFGIFEQISSLSVTVTLVIFAVFGCNVSLQLPSEMAGMETVTQTSLVDTRMAAPTRIA